MKCGEPVTVEYIWNNERKYACLKHAEQIEALGQLLGMPTQPRLIISNMTCPNEVSRHKEEECENENSLD